MAKARKVSIQKKRNLWYLVYRLPGHEKQIWQPTGTADEDVADQMRKRKEADIAELDYFEPSRDSLTKVADEWLSVEAVYRLAESTLGDYKSLLKAHIKPRFGNAPISKVRPRALQAFVSEKQGVLSNKRVWNMCVVLSDVFDYAERMELIRDNPMLKVRRPRVERKEVDFLEPEELWRLIAAVEQLQPFYAPLVLTAVMTGMRLGELRSLTWNRVDFDHGEIHVRSSQARKEVKGPKTKAGWRTIPMSALVQDVLEAQYARRIETCDLVFPSHRLTPFDPSNVRKNVLYKALDEAKVRRVTWHSLRHSAASLMAHSRADEKEIQAILGHSSIQVTKDTYTHLFHSAKRDAIDRMDDLMLRSRPEVAEEERSEYVLEADIEQAA